MLWGAEKDSVSIVIERITALLQSAELPNDIHVTYTVLEGDDAPQFMLSTTASAQKKGWRKMDDKASAI